ncbi:uncharacterized protein LOC113562597 [Ooceraea biroi]|uniref:uncharacterized protein LOC113562597 n=1 Tax=Ooceraea biroi TaxID=2015173 RepID=UPI000F096770|nr:uncharacterized protein LOC113562597 [Ooceraea biroi]
MCKLRCILGNTRVSVIPRSEALTFDVPSRSMRREEDSSRTSRADDIRRRGTVTSALKPVAGLSENRQTQCNLRDRDNLRKKQDNACSLALTSESEAWSCSVQPQYKAPEQVVSYQDHDQRKSFDPCDEHITCDSYRHYEGTKNICITEVSHRVPSYADVCSLHTAGMRF